VKVLDPYPDGTPWEEVYWRTMIAAVCAFPHQSPASTEYAGCLEDYMDLQFHVQEASEYADFESKRYGMECFLLLVSKQSFHHEAWLCRTRSTGHVYK
jgi:hypothetical protein